MYLDAQHWWWCRVTVTCGPCLRGRTRSPPSSTPRTRSSLTRSMHSAASSARTPGIYHFLYIYRYRYASKNGQVFALFVVEKIKLLFHLISKDTKIRYLHFFKSKITFFSFQNYFLFKFVQNIFFPEPAARPGACAGQDWTGYTTLIALYYRQVSNRFFLSYVFMFFCIISVCLPPPLPTTPVSSGEHPTFLLSTS